MTKDQITPEDLAIERFNKIIKARDEEIAALKAQVKARDIEINELNARVHFQIKELILLSQAAKRHEENCFKLKAQVNALREYLDDVSDLVNIPVDDAVFWLFDNDSDINNLLDKTPQQCLAEHNEVLIHKLIDEKSIENEYNDQLIMLEDIEAFIEEMKK